MHRGHHSTVQKMSRFVNAGSINEHDLPVLIRNDSLDAVTGGLRLVRDGGDLFTDEIV